MQCCSVLCAVPTQLCSFAEMGIGSHVRPARQSQDCLRGRPFRTLPISAILRSALGSVQPTVARGVSCVRLARSARHLAVTSLRSCARLRLRGYPPLRFGAFTFGCTFALRCIIRSPIRAARLRMEYHPSPSITVSTAPYASRRPCALRSPVALRLSPLRYWSRIPFPSCGASAPYSRAKRGMEQYMSFRQSLRPKNDCAICSLSLSASPSFLCKVKP
jgi:hypothetical protein